MIWLLGFFNYYSFAPYSKYTPLIFLLFTMTISLFLFNMMVAIIVAHYNEYMELQVVLEMAMEGNQQNFFQLMFTFVKRAVSPDAQAESAWRAVRCWHGLWKWMEAVVLGRDEEDRLVEEEMQILRAQLTNKYPQPKYASRDIQFYMKPYLNNEVQVTSNLATQRDEVDFNIKQDLNMKKMQIFDKNQEARTYRDLKIGVIKDLGEGVDHELKTSAAIWVAALEEELFTSSNCKILYTDLIAHEDTYRKEELFRFYDID